MLSFLKSRLVLVSVGLALIIWIVWMIDPFSKQIGPPLSQYVAVGLVLAWYGGWVLWQRIRAKRAGDQLAAAVVKQSAGEKPSADVVQLRERFEEAVAALKQKNKRGSTLYELPWYVIIGAPGSGKTTALVNSGLHFPLEQRSGKGALRGVGGTRNCDWWFTDEAVLLDTAGRYTTQDSDATADSAGWAEFLALLKKYRTRRPINGVLLAISAHDLMVQGQAGREAHVAAARRRLTELNKELKINIPVYVLVTKCDLVSGFSEYFDDVAQEGRTQVWGVTFPQEMTQSGAAAGAFGGEFDALMSRLNERVFARLEDDRDVRRRAKVFGFPQQMAALRESLSEFITDVFEATRFDQKVLLRGVYFTSGTQEGTPIDRLLGALSRRFSVPPEAVTPMGRGKAYFIERLLKDVVLAESGLASVNRRVEVQKAALQVGAYVGLVLVAVLGVILLTFLYNRNVAYVEKVGADAKRLERVNTASGASIDVVLNRLDAVHNLVLTADSRRQMVPWGTGWLFAGSQLSDAARQAYSREVDDALVDRLVALFRQRMSDSSALPVAQYRYLKGYLMLKDQKHLDTEYLGGLAALEWRSAYGNNAAIGEKLTEHFANLLEYQAGGFRTPTLESGDDVLVQSVRTRLQGAPPEELVYGEIQTRHQSPESAQSLEALSVFQRKSGGRFARSMPGLYTKPTFRKVVADDVQVLQRQLRDDYPWVMGEDRVQPTFPPDLDRRVIAVYEKDYIRAWDGLLTDLGFASGKGVEATRDALRVIAGKNSALRRVVELVDHHTFLVESAAPPKSDGFFDTVSSKVTGALVTFQSWLKAQGQVPGVDVTTHFLPLHAMLAGEPGKRPIDQLVAEIDTMGTQLDKIGGGVGQTQATDNDLRELGQRAESLQREGSELPGSAKAIGDIAAAIGKGAADATRSSAGNTLRDTYLTEVAEKCTKMITGRYPFVPNATGVQEVRLLDFGDMFGHGGTFDQFFKTHLERFVDTTRRPWSLKPGAPGGVPVNVFDHAQRIREMFFDQGRNASIVFSVSFESLDGGADRVQLDVDGNTPVPTYRHDGERQWKMIWPGPKPGSAVVTFDERGKISQNVVGEGDWALFKLIAQGLVSRVDAEHFKLTIGKDKYKAVIKIDAMRVNNVFAGLTTLHSFRCGG